MNLNWNFPMKGVKFVENRLSVSRQCLQGHYR